MKHRFEETYSGMTRWNDKSYVYKHPDIVPGNVQTILYHIGKNAELVRFSAERWKDHYYREEMKPNSLKDHYIQNVTFTEAWLMTEVMKEYIQFLSDKEKEIKNKSGEHTSEALYSWLSSFVGSTINTTFKVQKDTVEVYSENLELIDALQKFVKKQGYKFKQVATKQESDSWWGM